MEGINDHMTDLDLKFYSFSQDESRVSAHFLALLSRASILLSFLFRSNNRTRPLRFCSESISYAQASAA